MRRLVGVALSALLVAMPAAVQGQHVHGGQGMNQDSADQGMMGPGMHQGGMMGPAMMGMMGHSMMGGGAGGMNAAGMMGSAGGPGAILSRRTALKLTPDQVTRLEQLQQQEQKEIAPAMQQMHAAGAQAHQALTAETSDLKGYETAVRAMTEPMIAMRVARARARVEARQLLTPDQRKQLQAWSPSETMATCNAMIGTAGGGTMPGRLLGGSGTAQAP